MGQVTLKGVRKSYGQGEIIRGIDLDVMEGEFMVFVGPSGCGKSTTLRMIAGLEKITAGELFIDGVRSNDLRPVDRGLAMVFQSYALYPHMTVADNMGFALKMAGVARAERDLQVKRAAEILRITELLDRYPKELSGGQRQRVAIGRAIVRKPKVFLFDEPLSNLDAALRVKMRIELTRLHKELGTTMIYVTHDQVEAMTMGDRIAVFSQGRIEQVGRPMELYDRPANEYVAEFMGSPRINFIERPEAGISPEPQIALWKMLVGGAEDRARRIGIRPEHVGLALQGGGVDAVVELAEHLGDSSVVHLRVDGMSDFMIARVSGNHGQFDTGRHVKIIPDASRRLAFDNNGQRIE